MSKRGIAWIALLAMPIWFVCALTVSHYYEADHHPSQDPGDQYPKEAYGTPAYYAAMDLILKQEDLDVQTVMAWGTLGACLLTIIAIAVTVYFSVKSLQETRRSVNNQMYGERGIIDLSHVAIEGEDKEAYVDVTFRNIGNTSITILGLTEFVYGVHKEGKLVRLHPQATRFSDYMCALMRPGGVMSTDHAHKDIVITIDRKCTLLYPLATEAFEGDGLVIYQGMIAYRTVFGEIRRYGWTVRTTEPKSTEFCDVQGEFYTFDVPSVAPEQVAETSDGLPFNWPGKGGTKPNVSEAPKS